MKFELVNGEVLFKTKEWDTFYMETIEVRQKIPVETAKRLLRELKACISGANNDRRK